MYIYAYKNTSRGAKLLANALNCKMIKHENSNFRGERKKVVVNWGASNIPQEVSKCHILNRPQCVASINGEQWLSTLRKLADNFDVPLFTTDVNEADSWKEAGACVHLKDGVYTMDVKADTIFRIHQIDGKTVYVQYKAEIPQGMHEGTKRLIKRTGEAVRTLLKLDFCAITIGWVEATNRFYILNVNTAPELDEELAIIYANHLTYGVENGL